MLQTINFSNKFDFKAIHAYIERIPKIKKLNYIERIPKIKKLKNQSVKMTIFTEFTTDVAIPVQSNSIEDGLAMLYQQYHESEMTIPKIVNIDESKNKLIITYMPFLETPYKISLNITKQKG